MSNVPQSSLGREAGEIAFGLDAASFLVIAVLATTVHVREEAAHPSIPSIERELLEGRARQPGGHPRF